MAGSQIKYLLSKSNSLHNMPIGCCTGDSGTMVAAVTNLDEVPLTGRRRPAMPPLGGVEQLARMHGEEFKQEVLRKRVPGEVNDCRHPSTACYSNRLLAARFSVAPRTATFS